MRLALIMMVISGLGIGFLVPVKPRAAAPVAAVGAAPASKPAEPPRETVLQRSNGHFNAVADVNGELIRFLVDTGADTVALTMEDARRAHVDFDPARFTVVGRGAGGPVRGQEVVIREITLDGKRASEVHAVVLEGSELSLLGHSYLRELKSVTMSGDEMVLR